MYQDLFVHEGSDYIHLNAGTLSKVPIPVRNRLRFHEEEYDRNPTKALFLSYERFWRIQQLLAQYFGAQAEDLILRPNITQALNVFLMGIPLEEGEFLSTSHEYGAVSNIVKLRAQREGRQYREVLLENHDSTERQVDTIIRSLTERTRLLLVSHVITSTGALLPIERIAKETKRRGITFVVDGAHALGAIPLDFSQLDGVDCYGANLHKWMMAPKGTAFIWVPKTLQEKIQLQEGGWASFKTPHFLEKFNHGDPVSSRLFMQGCIDAAPFFAVEDLLEWRRAIGEKKIQAYIHQLQELLEGEIAANLGWKCLSPPKGQRGPLLAYEPPEAWTGLSWRLATELYTKIKIQVAVPLLGTKPVLRFSPGLHNSPEDILEAVRRLKEYPW